VGHVSTGAPGRRGGRQTHTRRKLFLKPGDVVECSIEGVATLRTHIVGRIPNAVQNAASFMSGRGKS